MSGAALAQLRTPAHAGVTRRRDGGGSTSNLDPVQQRVLELQRDAGNAAVTQLVGQAGAGIVSEAVPTDAATIAEAKAIFNQGAAAYDRGEFGKAYDQFTRSYELSGRTGLIFSRAQALRRLGGRREEAIALYQEYLDTGATERVKDSQDFIKELATPESTGDLEADTTTGKTAFDLGAKHYEKGDFAHAYDEFTKAWELTHRPGLLFSRAQALRRLGGRRQEAVDLYSAYIALGDGARDKDANEFITKLSTPESTGDLDKDTATGKSIFDQGAKFYDAGDFAHAYDEFSRSWELTGRPGLIFSQAQALRRLGGRREEAMELYQRYVDSGETNRIADAKSMLEELRTKGKAN